MSCRICVIGCGEMSNYGHGPSCARYAELHPETELAACCDLNEQRAVEYRNKFGFSRHYLDLDEMLLTEKPDAVCLIAPVDLTCELTCRVLAHGIPLIMEKPPGMTLDQVDRMIAAADELGVPNQVSFNRRYVPLMRELRNALKPFAAHDILHIDYELHRVNRPDADFSTTAIHGIDSTRFIAASDYTSVGFTCRAYAEAEPFVAETTLDCRFESGATARISFRPCTGLTAESATVYMRDHTFVLRLPSGAGVEPKGSLRCYQKDELVCEVSGGKWPELFVSGGFYDANASFFDDIRAGRKPAGDLRDSRQSVEIMQRMRELLAECADRGLMELTSCFEPGR